MDRLTVLYDERCGLCHRCREWMESQPALVPLEFVDCSSDEARRRYGELPWRCHELIAISADGRGWVGPGAFLVCLWALERWRERADSLAHGALSSVAEAFFAMVSANRRGIGEMLGHPCASGTCRTTSPYR